MIHTLDEVRAIYDELDKQCGVNTSSVTLKISNRAASRMGSCKCGASSNGKLEPKQITISEFVLENDALFENVIRHEYAHALVALRDPNKSHGHDKVWKAACVEIGCRPERIDNREETKEICDKQRKQLAKYRIACADCGAEWFYRRETKVIKRLKARRKIAGFCSQCHSSHLILERMERTK